MRRLLIEGVEFLETTRSEEHDDQVGKECKAHVLKLEVGRLVEEQKDEQFDKEPIHEQVSGSEETKDGRLLLVLVQLSNEDDQAKVGLKSVGYENGQKDMKPGDGDRFAKIELDGEEDGGEEDADGVHEHLEFGHDQPSGQSFDVHDEHGSRDLGSRREPLIESELVAWQARDHSRPFKSTFAKERDFEAWLYLKPQI